jgi:RNA polymerase sigma factor for flagellar operon FliA
LSEEIILPDLRFNIRASSAQNSSDDQRQRLILKHLPQVRLLARRIHGRLPESVTLDDLVSHGVLGLISAIDRFDPSHNTQLSTYAQHKIKGEILDSLRRMDSAPRQQRKYAKQIEAAVALAEQRWQRLPTDEEIAAALNLPVDVYRRRRANLHGLNLQRLESIEAGDSGTGDLRFLCRSEKECPSVVFERSELRRTLAAGIAQLPKIHQTVLSMYYRDELKLREISKIIGLHASRVSQIKQQAILRLRAFLAEVWPAGRRPYCPN